MSRKRDDISPLPQIYVKLFNTVYIYKTIIIYDTSHIVTHKYECKSKQLTIEQQSMSDVGDTEINISQTFLAGHEQTSHRHKYMQVSWSVFICSTRLSVTTALSRLIIPSIANTGHTHYVRYIIRS